MRATLKMVLTFLGITDAMAVCLLDSYGRIGDIAIVTVLITTAIGMPVFVYYMRRYHKKGF